MIRIMVADDHAIIRDGLKQIISFNQDMQVVGEAGSGDEILQLLRKTPCDLLLTDLSMPGRNGVALIQQVKASHPKLAVLVLSMHQESQYAVQAIRAGASGYITKSMASQQLIEGIRKVARGGTFISAAIAEKLVRQIQQPENELPHARLTSREFQIFQMLVEGRSVNEIADALSLSNKTVSTHKSNIQQKMEIETTAGLVHYAMKHGLIEGA
ncbi:MAG TPA: response regulator transcription factor [Rhodocyclaceae bacterium]|jgi:DNA-binding NarL/FixJ family response regulator|nr:response regulator transcription factor [Rhodocyclaceae bacterium]